jgi:branched-chain amino acid transport system substrate-binding protein
MQYIGIFLPLLILCLSLTGCNRDKTTGEQQSKGNLNVGVALPFTGDAAVYGKAIKNGIELALEEHVKKGGKPINLIYEDDQGLPSTAVTVTQRLIDLKKVPVIIGGGMSSTAEATIPVCNDKQVVLLSPAASKPSLIKKGSYFFRIWPSDDYDGKIMAEVARNKLNIKNVSIVYINVAYGVGVSEVFEREFTKLGGQIPSKYGYKQGETDFRTILTKIKKDSPEAVYLPGYVSEVSQLLRQAKELGVNAKFLGVNSFYDPKLIEIAGEAAEGAVFTYPTFDAKSPDPAIAGFVSAYKNKFGVDPDAFAVQGYDALRVIAKSIEHLQNDKVTGPDIRQSLLSMGRYEGPGGTFVFDENGDVKKDFRVFRISKKEIIQMK